MELILIMSKTFQQLASITIIQIVEPLSKLQDHIDAIDFIKNIGWDLSTGIDIELSISNDVQKFVDKLGELNENVDSLMQSEGIEAINIAKRIYENLPGLLNEVKTIANSLHTIILELQSNNPEIIISGSNVETNTKLLSRRLFDYLIYAYFRNYKYRLYSVLRLTGFVEQIIDDSGMPIKTIHWDRISDLFANTESLITTVYQWNTDDFDSSKLLHNLDIIIDAFSISGGLYTQSDVIRYILNRPAGDDEEIRFPLYRNGQWPESYMELDINLSPVPKKDNDNLSGLFLFPYLMMEVNDLDNDLSDNWSFSLQGTFQTNPNIGLELRPPRKFKIVNNIFDPENLAEAANFQVDLDITKKQQRDDLYLIFGNQQESRLGYKELNYKVRIGLEGGEFATATELNVEDLTLVIDSGEGDGFIQSILSGLVLESISDITVGISSIEGFYFSGSSQLDITIGIHKTIGPLYIDELTIGIGFDERINILLATTFSLTMGPVKVSIKNIGLDLPITISNNNEGNLGPVDIHKPSFKHPEGVGIAIKSSGLTGGGYLDIDKDNYRYTGVLALKFKEIALTAIGIITTRMPDGSDGYSMLVNIGVTFAPPITLPYNFVLKGVGGLIGINRAMSIDALRDGLINQTLDSILFPDPSTIIENANSVISNMRTVFPAAEGRYVVGPMLKLGWGGNKVTADIGVFIELPSPVEVVILGQITALFPNPTQPQVVLNIDVMGVWNVPQKKITIDSVVYNSRIHTYDLSGDAALLLRYGNNPNFVMSVGGFHPRFSAPPEIRSLRKLSLTIRRSENFIVNLNGYHALTTNTLQLGASADLYVKSGRATCTGNLSFDAIIYFSPFSFETNISGNVVIRYRGKRLAGIYLSLNFEGPRPWKVNGDITVEIFVWDVTVSINRTWGSSSPLILAAIDPKEKLTEALENSSSWGARLPEKMHSYEMLADLADTESALIVHPAGAIEIRQNVLPFDVQLDKLGNAPVTGNDYFDITSVSLDGNNLSLLDIEEDFAPGQFKQLHDPLTAPSFEKMKAGVAAASDSTQFSEDKINSVEHGFESILITDKRLGKKGSKRTRLAWSKGVTQLARTVQRNRQLNSTTEALFKNRNNTNKVKSRTQTYCVVKKDDLALISPVNESMGYTKANDLMNNYILQDPSLAGSLDVIESYEVT